MASFSTWTWVSWYQNVAILDFIGAKDNGGGGDIWSCKDVQSSSQIVTTNKPTPIFIFGTHLIHDISSNC